MVSRDKYTKADWRSDYRGRERAHMSVPSRLLFELSSPPLSRHCLFVSSWSFLSTDRVELQTNLQSGSAEAGTRDEAQTPAPPSQDRPASPTKQPSADSPRALGSGGRRRSSGTSRRSGRFSVLSHPTSLAERTQGKFTFAGPDDTPQVRRAHEPFVQPGYADLNPEYDQASSAKPVWSLAKPLPRVVRPGMVPTREELLSKPEVPAENSQKLGLDVDLSELEKGRIQKSTNPRKIAAQVADARRRREANLVKKLLSGDAASTRRSSSSIRPSSNRSKSAATSGLPVDQLTPVEEGEPLTEDQLEDARLDQDDDVLEDVPDERSPLLGDQTDSNIDEKNVPEDLHPLVAELVEDEIHNHHTTWSVIRTHHREALAEFLAVYVQLTVGFCADLAVTFANAGNPNTTAWAWGLATMMAIYISGGVSGAHLNPAVTVVLWFYRGFPTRKLPDYFGAQFIGAFLAAISAYGIYYGPIQHYLSTNPDGIVGSFVTGPQSPWITPVTAFFNEFAGTGILIITLLALGDDQNAPPGAGMNSLIVGLIITCLSVTFAYETGGALNPSRDFGPRLALLLLGHGRELFTKNWYWLYGPWAGALGGALVGAFLYDFLIFTGGESPINYPLERTQRALKKTQMKWKRRLHLA
ncbi:hypothetical protein DTO063F5_7313 [Paecilomyces variotii]|nr:hypothetical protein DTO063F5_7313 [Paecilomyces variotii]